MNAPDPRPDAPPKRPPLWTVFESRNYRLFFAGQLLSLMGTWMQNIAQAWLVWRLTESPVALGLVGFAQQGPVLLLSPFGGAIADRWPRRRLLLVTNAVMLIQAVALTALTFAGAIALWHIIALAALLGVVNAVDIPTRQSFTMEMVGRSHLQNAIALNSIVFNLARLAGPAAAGVLVAAYGEAWCFALNAASFLAALVALPLMRLPPFAPKPPKSVIQELIEGFRYVARTPDLRGPLLLLAAVSLASMPYITLLPAFVESTLRQDARGFGALMSCIGAGALFGAVVMSRLQPAMLRRAPPLAAILFGTMLVALSATTSYWLALLWVTPAAFGLMMLASTTNTHIQQTADDAMRGRVMAYFTIAFIGMAPLGALWGGAAAAAIGVPATIGLGGALCAAAGLFAMQRRAA